MQIRKIYPFLQADEALSRQIAGSALSCQPGALCCAVILLASSSQQDTHTSKSAHLTSQATVKGSRNRCVNQVELRIVSQRNFAVII